MEARAPHFPREERAVAILRLSLCGLILVVAACAAPPAPRVEGPVQPAFQAPLPPPLPVPPGVRTMLALA
jgi:hypothetical protein